ncbi:MAG: choice-of-anchor tandem repeat GloVer-containing protein [Candidatus Binataceae bacterium]
MNRIVMVCAAASMLLAITTATGKSAEFTSLGSPTPSLDALASDAISESLPWSFGATSDDGIFPWAGLIADKWGNLYGTTAGGGPGGNVGEICCGVTGGGTAFELSPPSGKQTQWSERVLWDFGVRTNDGSSPYVGAGLIFDKWGNLYGTTSTGGAYNNGGTVFELSPPTGKQTQWSERVLWSFTFGGNSTDANTPAGNLIFDKWGNLYGTTNGGGVNGVSFFGEGTVFELSPPSGKSKQWNERVLWSFGTGTDDGTFPLAGLIADKWGNLYGTTIFGGANGYGTVFELSPPIGQQTQWNESVLWSFGNSDNDDGAYSTASLIFDKWGNLYGTTNNGGSAGSALFVDGTVFELRPPVGQQSQWSERLLWSFIGEPAPGFNLAFPDGEGPSASLIFDKWGNLYGTTGSGGAFSRFQGGTVFELSPPAGQQAPWSERLLWSFSPDGDGYNPYSNLITDEWGNLYGTTRFGGANCLVCGTVFKLSLSGWGQ